MRSRLYVFDACRRGKCEECRGETRDDSCTHGCHAEVDEVDVRSEDFLDDES